MAKTAIVKCILKYHDIEMDKLILKNQEIEVSTQRCKVLIQAKVCELIEIR